MRYENEIFELKACGKTNREISEELGYSLEQV
jgi:DNA-binding NarL/FixJ family response regulator